MKVVKGDKVYDIVRGKGLVLDCTKDTIIVEFLTYVNGLEYKGYYNQSGVYKENYINKAHSLNRTLFKYKKYMKLLKHINKKEWLRLTGTMQVKTTHD